MRNPGTHDRGTRDATESMVSLSKLFSYQTRLEIFLAVAASPGYVCEIAAELELSCSLVSHHLRILQDAGLVAHPHDGHRPLYAVAPEIRVLREEERLVVSVPAGKGAIQLSTPSCKASSSRVEIKHPRPAHACGH